MAQVVLPSAKLQCGPHCRIEHATVQLPNGWGHQRVGTASVGSMYETHMVTSGHRVVAGEGDDVGDACNKVDSMAAASFVHGQHDVGRGTRRRSRRWRDWGRR